MQRKVLTIRLKSKSDQKYPKKLPTKLFTKFDASLTASEQNNHTTGSHTTATEVTDNDTSPKSTNEQTPSVSYDYKNSGQRITDQHIERKQSAPLVHEPSRTRTRTEQQVLLQYSIASGPLWLGRARQLVRFARYARRHQRTCRHCRAGHHQRHGDV